MATRSRYYGTHILLEISLDQLANRTFGWTNRQTQLKCYHWQQPDGEYHWITISAVKNQAFK